MLRNIFLTLLALALAVLIVGNGYLIYARIKESAAASPGVSREVERKPRGVVVTLQAQDDRTGRRVTVTYTVPEGRVGGRVTETEWRAIQLLLGLPEKPEVAAAETSSPSTGREKAKKKDDWVMLPELKDDPRFIPGTRAWAEEEFKQLQARAAAEIWIEEQARLEQELGRPVDLKNGRFADGSGELLPEHIRKKYMKWYIPREQLGK